MVESDGAAGEGGRNQAGRALGISGVKSDYLRFVRHQFAHRPGPQAKLVAECVKLEQDVLVHWIERDVRSVQNDKCTRRQFGDRRRSVCSNFTRVADQGLRPS